MITREAKLKAGVVIASGMTGVLAYAGIHHFAENAQALDDKKEWCIDQIETNRNYDCILHIGDVAVQAQLGDLEVRNEGLGISDATAVAAIRSSMGGTFEDMDPISQTAIAALAGGIVLGSGFAAVTVLGRRRREHQADGQDAVHAAEDMADRP